ncbi:putative transcriptional acitvator, Baf family [Halothece sp. PCC 7418]|uniref:pantothenate kinase n=1 Tax=Halothece sp. (strain PCC 7418) TaxID=65093 RepID=UPI0002A06391|nr:pantothenate kinase [Halothece sp. PCC 7418]AFZ42611.1 putative transcriptional acitvator, Baf family [Halothece sp. PCC 7418]
MDYLALVIGNSRLHWGWLKGKQLLQTWDTPHLKKPITDFPRDLFPKSVTESLPNKTWIYIISVVPEQTKLWQNYPDQTVITKDQIPLNNLYATLGSDRAVCAYGAGETYGYPVLVIDGGTALTYTAVGQQKDFLGGAILPGLRLQLRALNQQTAALSEASLPEILPPLWANSTDSAIASGVIYTLISGIYFYVTDWLKRSPEGQIIFTGGDAILLHHYLQEKDPTFSQKIIIDQRLMFQGIARLIRWGEWERGG